MVINHFTQYKFTGNVSQLRPRLTEWFGQLKQCWYYWQQSRIRLIRIYVLSAVEFSNRFGFYWMTRKNHTWFYICLIQTTAWKTWCVSALRLCFRSFFFFVCLSNVLGFCSLYHYHFLAVAVALALATASFTHKTCIVCNECDAKKCAAASIYFITSLN